MTDLSRPPKVRRIDFYPDEWLVGTRALTMEERAVYFHVLMLIYSQGGPIVFNASELAYDLRTKPVKVESVVRELIAKGKLSFEEGRLSNRRAMSELSKAADRIQQNRTNGRTGGRPPKAQPVVADREHPEQMSSTARADVEHSSSSSLGTDGEVQEIISGNGGGISSKNNDLEEPNGFGDGNLTTTSTTNNHHQQSHGAASRPGRSRYAFEGQVIRLTPRDFDAWRSAYHAIPDLSAELTSLDAYYAAQPENERKRWFQRASGALNRKHQEHLANRPAHHPAKPRPQAKDWALP